MASDLLWLRLNYYSHGSQDHCRAWCQNCKINPKNFYFYFLFLSYLITNAVDAFFIMRSIKFCQLRQASSFMVTVEQIFGRLQGRIARLTSFNECDIYLRVLDHRLLVIRQIEETIWQLLLFATAWAGIAHC